MRAATLLALLPLAPCCAAPSNRKRNTPAPVYAPLNAERVKGRYIIMMKGEAQAEVVANAVSGIATDAAFTYSNCFRGFAAEVTPAELESLRDNADVDYIEQDAMMKAYAAQPNADYGLARISNARPNSTTYTFDDSAGEGTCTYIIDSGIDANNPEFGGRAKFVANFADEMDGDTDGHGTHVAGIIGSRTYGVAKKTKLFGVKALGAEGGTNSQVIAAMEFVVNDAALRACPKGVVVNMSFGGMRSRAVNSAAASIANAGFFLAVAAGNERDNASNSSPASESSACTVGATTRNDTLASYSNVGRSVDLLAPGSNIESLWIGNMTMTLSGTSMASPHVAGLAAYFLGTGRQVQDLCKFMAKKALKNIVSQVPDGTPNRLINNGMR